MSSLEEKKDGPAKGEQIVAEAKLDAEQTVNENVTPEEREKAEKEVDEDAKSEGSSKDIVELLEEHNEEEDLLEKLGLKKKVDIPYEKMNDKQKDDQEKLDDEQKENQKKADKMIQEAKDKLEEIRKATVQAIQDVQDLKQANVDKKIQLDRERNRGTEIEKNYDDAIKKMRTSKIGEIYYIMKESREDENEEKKDAYCWIIHNYLLCLFLEDNPKDNTQSVQLLEDIGERQKQIHENYVRQFNELVKDIRGVDNPAKEFKKIFPKPEPKREDREKFQKFYGMYEDWVKTEFTKGDEDDADGNILDQTEVDSQFSSLGVSQNVQSVIAVAEHAKDMKDVDAIAEGDEDEEDGSKAK